MSSLSLVSASTASTSILQDAQHADDKSLMLLNSANDNKTAVGSIEHQIEQVEAHLKQINEIPRTAANFFALKHEFIQFIEVQLSKYEAVKKNHENGLKTIETAKNAHDPFSIHMDELTNTLAKVAEQIRILETSLNKALFTKKSIEDAVEIPEMLKLWYDNPYLLAVEMKKK
jgi:hypothetical protein